MTKKSRIKSEAAAWTPANREEVDAAISQIGIAQRARDELATRMNAELAAVKERFEAEAAQHAAVIKELGAGVQTWCEARRLELTKEGRIKTHKFGAGEVSWRMRPPRCLIRGEVAVLEALKRLGLDRFIRTKEEIDKSAILDAPEAVTGIKGVSITQGEDFVIKPFATELEEVQS
jgi:phage host-nuclease inhibitor protein Gam